jgi:hypothetical protein
MRWAGSHVTPTETQMQHDAEFYARTYRRLCKGLVVLLIYAGVGLIFNKAIRTNDIWGPAETVANDLHSTLSLYGILLIAAGIGLGVPVFLRRGVKAGLIGSFIAMSVSGFIACCDLVSWVTTHQGFVSSGTWGFLAFFCATTHFVIIRVNQVAPTEPSGA